MRAGRFHFEGSVYSSWFTNYIYGDLTGRTCDDTGLCSAAKDGAFRELLYRQQSAHFRGIEGRASYELVDAAAGMLTANMLADYTRATLGDGSNVPRIPPYRVGGGFDWTSDRFDAGFTLTRVGRQEKTDLYDTPTEGYLDIDAQVSWRPFAEHQGIELAVIGQNLANEVERNAAALNKDEVIAAGRSVRFVVKLALP